MAPVAPSIGSRIRRRIRERTTPIDVPLLMPYLYIVALGLAILVIGPELLQGLGAIDALFALIVPLALVAFGQTLVLLTRGIDLSIGGLISVVSALLATHLNTNGAFLVVELLGIVAMGIAIGTLNGFVITVTRIQPFIVTLATWSIWGGVAFAILPIDGGTVSTSLVSALTHSVLGIPLSICVMAALFILWRVLRPTRFVGDLIAIGSDEGRAHLLGVRIARRKIQAYAVSAFLAALAGIWLAAQTQAGSPQAGNQFILSSIAAVVLGGTSIFGGKGSAASSVAGAIAFMLIPDLVFALGLGSFWSIFFQGFILVVAVVFNSVVQRPVRLGT